MDSLNCQYSLLLCWVRECWKSIRCKWAWCVTRMYRKPARVSKNNSTLATTLKKKKNIYGCGQHLICSWSFLTQVQMALFATHQFVTWPRRETGNGKHRWNVPSSFPTDWCLQGIKIPLRQSGCPHQSRKEIPCQEWRGLVQFHLLAKGL